MKQFPGDIINPALQLEDVLEEVTDEINEKGKSSILYLHYVVSAFPMMQ